MSDKIITLDVREMPPQERRPRIFEYFDNLTAGETLKLVNDHEPIPLHHDLMRKRGGQFEWTSKEKNPGEWVAMIKKIKEVQDSMERG